MTYRTIPGITASSLVARLLAMVVTVVMVTVVAGVAPAQAGSGDYSLSDKGGLRVRWDPCLTITFSVNPQYLSSTTAGRASGVRDVLAAMSQLATRTGITFVYEGTTTQIPRDTSTTRWWDRQNGSEIVVAWVRQGNAVSRSNLLGSGALGSGGYVYKSWDQGTKLAIGRGFVVLDAAKSLPAGFGSGVTRGSLLLHELGHAVGLNHVSARSELMYPTLLSRSSATYQSGDRTGLSLLGRNAGCIGVPSSVWTQV